MDKKKIAADLRLESNRLIEEARQLQQAADVLDPPARVINASVAIEASTQVEAAAETIIDRVVLVLKKAGRAIRKEQLFEQVQARGEQVANIESFSSALSRAKDKVVRVGSGLWDLRERHPEADLSPPLADTDSVSPESIRQFLHTRNARVRDLARHFRTTDESIQRLIEDPANGIRINGPGWLKLAQPPQVP